MNDNLVSVMNIYFSITSLKQSSNSKQKQNYEKIPMKADSESKTPSLSGPRDCRPCEVCLPDFGRSNIRQSWDKNCKDKNYTYKYNKLRNKTIYWIK